MSLFARMFGRGTSTRTDSPPADRHSKTSPDPQPSTQRVSEAATPGSDSPDITTLLATGVERQNSGDVAGAEGCYLEAIERFPKHPGGYHLLGALVGQNGDLPRAATLLEQAVSCDSATPEPRIDLGNVYRLLDREQEAEASYRNALDLSPEHPLATRVLIQFLVEEDRSPEARELVEGVIARDEADPLIHFHYGNLLANDGETAGAIREFQAALAGQEAFPEAHHNLAVALHTAADSAPEALADAKRHYQRALALRPEYVDAHFNYAQCLEKCDEWSAAERSYETALGYFPEFLLARRRLAYLKLRLGENDAALEHFRQVAEAAPDSAEAQFDLGLASERRSANHDALTYYRNAVSFDATHAPSLANLGVLRSRDGALAEGAKLLESSIESDSTIVESWNSLGGVRQMQADLTAAVECYDRAIELDADAHTPRQNRLTLFNYRGDVSADEVASAHRDWAAYLERVDPVAPINVVHSPDPAGRLRIGYLSPDFRTHSVAYFLEPILRAHDRTRHEIVAFASVANPDTTTDRLRGLVDKWIDISHLDDEAAAAAVVDAGIDILVDLAGYTVGNRVGVLRRRPAPVQATYIGYPNTTGLDEVDYRLVDGVTDPPEYDARCTETLVRLEKPFLVYQPATESALIPLAASESRSGPFTFASFNELLKITPQVIAAWSRIMNAVPDSRLMLKGSALADAPTRERLAGCFVAHGVEAERLELLARTETLSEHFALYNQVDLALDTFPYNGTTTTCEAMWMNVPVLAVAGDRHASRVSASLLGAVGEASLITESVDEYVDLAIALATDSERLAQHRTGLRDRMMASSLMQADAFTRGLEAKYAQMWQSG